MFLYSSVKLAESSRDIMATRLVNASTSHSISAPPYCDSSSAAAKAARCRLAQSTQFDLDEDVDSETNAQHVQKLGQQLAVFCCTLPKIQHVPCRNTLGLHSIRQAACRRRQAACRVVVLARCMEHHCDDSVAEEADELAVVLYLDSRINIVS